MENPTADQKSYFLKVGDGRVPVINGRNLKWDIFGAGYSGIMLVDPVVIAGLRAFIALKECGITEVTREEILEKKEQARLTALHLETRSSVGPTVVQQVQKSHSEIPVVVAPATVVGESAAPAAQAQILPRSSTVLRDPPLMNLVQPGRNSTESLPTSKAPEAEPIPRLDPKEFE